MRRLPLVLGGVLVWMVACSAGDEAAKPASLEAGGLPPIQRRGVAEVMAALRTSGAAQIQQPRRPDRFADGFRAEAQGHDSPILVRQALRTQLPLRSNQPVHLAPTTAPDAWVEIEPEGAGDVPATTDAEAIVYRGALGDADIVRLTGEDAFEELHVVHAAQPVVRGSWRLKTGPGIATVRSRSSRLELADARGYVHIQTHPMFAVDADGKRVAAEARVEGGDGLYRVIVEAAVKGLKPPIILDPTFTSGGVLNSARANHNAVLLPSGKILFTRGSGANALELYDPDTNTVSQAWASPNTAYSAELLPDGRVLLVGKGTTEAHVFNPSSGMSTAVTLRESYHDCHVHTRLLDDRILYSGCQHYGGTNYSELVSPNLTTENANTNPNYGSWTEAVGAFAAVTLLSGKVFVATGSGSTLFDPNTKMWAPTKVSCYSRHRAVARLADGRVILAGGEQSGNNMGSIYDPATDECTLSAVALSGSRTRAQATAIGTGAIVMGGFSAAAGGGAPYTALTSSELFSTTTNMFALGPQLAVGRANFTVTPLQDGRIVVAGGHVGTSSFITSGTATNTIEIFVAKQQGATCTTNECGPGLTCLDGVCCATATCPTGSSCNHPGAATGTCHKDQGRACTEGDECGTGICADGYCCESDCGDKGRCDVTGSRGKCLAVDGEACDAGTDCVTGFCVDGVCCDTACPGVCRACSAEKKGGGADGVCEVVAADTDPDENCPTDPGYPQSCRSDGLCDGLGNCRVYAKPGTACGETTCASDTVSGDICNGGGVCADDSSPCAPYGCDGDACGTSCSSPNDCADDAYCAENATCASKKANGTECSAAAECASGFCADGLCCSSACTGQCEACAEPDSEGSCVPVTGAPRGERLPCAGELEVCGGQCNGSKSDECSYPTSAKTCGRTCANGSERRNFCDGLGECAEGDAKACLPYACLDEQECAVDCSSDEHCADSYRCQAGTCVARSASTCSDDGLSSVSVEGEPESCAPYVCDEADGRCKLICRSSDDCQDGYLCDTERNVCSQGTSGGTDDGGCGCRIVQPRRSNAAALWLLGVAGLAWQRRRRRATSAARSA